MIPQIFNSRGKVKTFFPILQHPRRLHLIVMRLKFCIWYILIGLVVERVDLFKDGGLDFSVLHMYKFAVIKVGFLSIK